MAWCPKCKNEYREGITVCAECGCELVDEQQALSQTPIIYGPKEIIALIKGFMEYNGLKNVNAFLKEGDNIFEIYVNTEDAEKAKKCASVFLEQHNKAMMKQREMELQRQKEQAEAANQASENANAPDEVRTVEEVDEDSQKATVTADSQSDEVAQSESEEAAPVVVAPGSYLNSAQKAEDNRSSAWTLLLVGGIGMVIMILGILGLLPFKVGNPYMFYGVMSAIFILFIVMGFVSMKNAKFFAKNAESENNLKKTVLDWCRENLKAEQIDSHIQYSGEISEEVLYLQRYAIIKYMINHQFMNLDQGLVERLVDDEVYDMVYPSEDVDI